MVIDASVALKWFFVEEESERAFALIGGTPLHAPALIHAEVGNAIWKKRARGELVGDVAAIDIGLLEQVLTITPDQGLVADALRIAVDLSHAIYDCFYLALAERLRVPLVTADVRFARKLSQAGFGGSVEMLG